MSVPTLCERAVGRADHPTWTWLLLPQPQLGRQRNRLVEETDLLGAGQEQCDEGDERPHDNVAHVCSAAIGGIVAVDEALQTDPGSRKTGVGIP